MNSHGEPIKNHLFVLESQSSRRGFLLTVKWDHDGGVCSGVSVCVCVCVCVCVRAGGATWT